MAYSRHPAPSLIAAALLLAATVQSQEPRPTSLSRVLGKADSFFERGQYDSALAGYGDALRAARSARTDSSVVLRKIGELYVELGRPDSAMTYLLKAVASGTDPDDRARSMNAMGRSYTREGQRDSALAFHYFRRGLEIQRDPAVRAALLHNLGIAYHDVGMPDSALASLRTALGIREAGGDRRGEIATLNMVATVHLFRRRSDTALAVLQNVRAKQTERAGADSLEVARTLSLMGRAYRSGDEADLETAVEYFDSATTVYTRLRRHTASDANAVSYLEQIRGTFEAWAFTWLVKSSSRPQLSLAAAERGRAQAALDFMVRHRGDEREKERLDAFSQTGRLDSDAAYLLAMVKTQRRAVLYYLQTDSVLVVWFITSNGEIVKQPRRSITPDSLATLVQALRESFRVDSAKTARGVEDEPSWDRNDDGSAIVQPAPNPGAALAVLSDILLPRELATVLRPGEEIVVIPYGVISLVPFAALRPPGVPTMPLGIRNVIRYAPSLWILDYLQRLRLPKAELRLLLVGNPTMPAARLRGGQTKRLSDLPSARDEADSIQLMYPETQVLSGDAATETRIRELMPKAETIHLATHGLAFSDPSLIRDSYVALAPDRANNRNGVLTLGEIMDDTTLTLKAELVVLSACQTGIGFPTRAEGMIAFQRALLGRGAKSVLVSLWSVDDEATALLMSRFHAYLFTARSSAEALWLAQREVQARDEWKEERFWAAFQLVGS